LFNIIVDKFKFISKNKLNELPKTSGVYCFASPKPKGGGGLDVIYVGKAINIRGRVKNHFQQPSYRDNLFINKITRIGFIETSSEIDALILEANLIKKYQPKYNVMWRDDKNYFYVAIAKKEQDMPYIFITHQKNHAKTEYIGPFVEGTSLKKVLRFLRRVFPYYTTKKHSKNKCTYCHLDLCPGPNPDLNDYKKNIRKLILILKGKRNAVLNSLKKEMRQLSKENKFEEAARARDKIFSLQQVMSHGRVLEGPTFQGLGITLEKIVGVKKNISRIEAYDVSNIQGKQATGSMVVFVNGQPDKNQYRKFKIRIKNEPNDIAMLKETLQRRFLHPEWKYPEVILIDGGKAQLNIAIEVLHQHKSVKSASIRVLAIAKKNNKLYIEARKNPVLLKTLPREIFNLILQLRDEAHRFAIAYHKKLRKKNLLA